MSAHSSEISPLIQRDRWASAIPAKAVKPPSMRIFGLIMLIGFGILGGLLLWSWSRTGSQFRLGAGSALVGVGVLLFLWSLLSPGTLPPVYHAWMKFGMGIGTVVSTVLLSVMYFVVVMPVGLLMRLTGTDPLERRLSRGPGSYWRAHAAPGGPDDYTHMS
ncbi:MAG TPA: SxtJ family membrane protein [Gemmatimonadaceae bacterium]|nr:SxtJ family membrane protein [Gemmatimonadaceae bacterium]